jgi:hypothetical protein
MQTKRPLGKIIALLLLLGLPLFAGVTASVDNPAVYRGDPVTLTLNATDGDVRFPTLTEIAGYPVEDSGTSRNVMIANGRTTRSVQQRLVFTPTADVTIPSVAVTVDGKTEHTLPIRVKVLDPKAAPAGAPIQLDMRLSKTQAYVGEPVELDLVFKYKPGTRIDDIRISEPKFEHFWIKRINTQPERSADEEGYITQTYRYLLFAQQPGDLNIPAIFAQVGTKVKRQIQSPFNDPFFDNSIFGSQMQYKKIYSNPAALHALALPDGLDVYGTFTMDSDVDKTTVEANRPVNLHIHIEGNGNVEDIKKFEPHFEHAVVYANDPVTKGSIKNGAYYGTFDQTIAIIPDRDITIPPQAFRFFDSRTKKVSTLRTHPYFIKVTGAAAAAAGNAPVVESAAVPEAPAATPERPVGSGSFNLYQALGFFGAGFVLGAALLWLPPRRRARKHADISMHARLKAAKKERELFELLLPYKGRAAVIDETLDKLEANLYRGETRKIDRKALLAYFDKKEEEITFI